MYHCENNISSMPVLELGRGGGVRKRGTELLFFFKNTFKSSSTNSLAPMVWYIKKKGTLFIFYFSASPYHYFPIRALLYAIEI